MSEADQTVWVISSFISGMVIIYLTARIVGNERKTLWFRKREKFNFFTKRGFLGDRLNFGVPRCWQGFAVSLAMVAAISLSSCIIMVVVKN